MKKDNIIRYIIEFLGTLVVVYITLLTNNVYIVGFSIMLTMYVGQMFALTHNAYNPLVTIAQYFTHYYSTNALLSRHALFFIGSQVLGAVAAILIYNIQKCPNIAPTQIF